MASQALLLSAGLAMILCLLQLAQRLGDWRSRKMAHLLTTAAVVLGLCWAYLIFLWIFKVDVRRWFESHWIWSAAALVLGTIALLLYARTHVGWIRRGHGPTLQFGEWHGGTDRGYPAKVNGGAPSWISIRNTEVSSPKTAKNVSAQIEWINQARTTRLSVPETDWYVREGIPGKRTVEGWFRSADIEGGDEQSCVLLVTAADGRLWVYKHGTEPVGVLDYGQWSANLFVTSDNAEGFEGTLGFTLTRSGLFPDRPRAFALRRRIPPRLR